VKDPLTGVAPPAILVAERRRTASGGARHWQLVLESTPYHTPYMSASDLRLVCVVVCPIPMARIVVAPTLV